MDKLKAIVILRNSNILMVSGMKKEGLIPAKNQDKMNVNNRA